MREQERRFSDIQNLVSELERWTSDKERDPWDFISIRERFQPKIKLVFCYKKGLFYWSVSWEPFHGRLMDFRIVFPPMKHYEFGYGAKSGSEKILK